MADRLIALEHWMAARRTEIINDIIALAAIDSVSGDIGGLRRCHTVLTEWFEELNLTPRIEQTEGGPLLTVESGSGEAAVLLLFHCDTVFPADAPNKPPLGLDGELLRGPGVLDMKGSIVMAIQALRAFSEFGYDPGVRLKIMITPDEEVGSPASQAVVRQVCSHVDAALVPEPSQKTDGLFGALKKSRMGGGIYFARVSGRAAHAGTNPEDGINAIHLLPSVIATIAELNRPGEGRYCNATVIEGGTAANTIPDRVALKIDMRFGDAGAGREMDQTIRAMRPDHPEAMIEFEGGILRPPMVESPGGTRLIRLYQKLAREFDVGIDAVDTGGGSDGNFTADEGVPTLDGIGLDGGGAHTAEEHVSLQTLPTRFALFAECILRIGELLNDGSGFPRDQG